jgi:hypothetical protein
MKAEPCRHHTLAEGGSARVDRCDHGTMHLTLGALTLRLTPEQLADLAATLEAAVGRIHTVGESEGGRFLC